MCVHRDPAGGVPEGFLHDFDVRPVCPQKGRIPIRTNHRRAMSEIDQWARSTALEADCRHHWAFVEGCCGSFRKSFPPLARRYSPKNSSNHRSSGFRNLGIARTSNPRNRMIKTHGSNAAIRHAFISGGVTDLTLHDSRAACVSWPKPSLTISRLVRCMALCAILLELAASSAAKPMNEKANLPAATIFAPRLGFRPIAR
jgi:hypothetical protein